MHEIPAAAAKIKLVIFDVDGVLTDGSLYLGDAGMEYKAFNSRDGYGMKMLQESGIEIGIITSRSSQAVTQRMESLGIQHVFQGQLDKLSAFEALKKKLSLQNEHIAFVGDDIVDLPVMLQVGLAIAVQDAHPLVTKHAHWQTPSAGGRGAARDVCELLMEAQQKLDAQFGKYLVS